MNAPRLLLSRRVDALRICSRLDRRHFAHEATSEAGGSSATSKSRLAMFFPGQGVQRVGMLQPWLEAFPKSVKRLMDEVDSVLGFNLTRIIEEGPNSALNTTINSQPAIMASSIIIIRTLEKEFGFKPKDRVDIIMGHSLGEFAALVTGGYLKYHDALKLVRKRAEIMQRCAQEASEEDHGEVGMIALLCEEDRLDSLIAAIHEFVGYGSPGSKTDSSNVPSVQKVLIANINSKNQVVLSGSISRIKTLLTNLRVFGGHDPRAVQLKSDCPMHSPLMIPAAEGMKRMLHAPLQKGEEDLVTFPGLMPCISNVTARPFRSKDELKDLLARQVVETVLWSDSIKYVDQEQNVRRWLGIGPGKVGRNLVGKEVGIKGAVKGGGVWGISHPREVDEILKALDDTEHYSGD